MGTPSRVAGAAAAAVAGVVPGVPGVVAGLTDRTQELYLGAAGLSDLGTGSPMRTDQVLAIFSATKAVTGTTVLQLVEQGDLELDAPAEQYVPALGEIQVLAGFDATGEPMLRAPRRPITTKHLLLHTAGFGYDFFNADYLRLATEHGQPPIAAATAAALRTPLLFDPGERWEYGSSIDWAGQVVECITGRRLGEVMAQRVFGPLGMTDTGFTLTDDTLPRTATLHRRRPDGTLAPRPFVEPAPELHMGGQGLFSTVPDYLRFLRMWLHGGAADSGEQVLRPETVDLALRDQLGGLTVPGLRSVNPALAHDMDHFPGRSASWGYTFLITDEDAPTGRPAGSAGWAGLANLYYWIDRRNGIAGFWATQVLPFGDPAALAGHLAMETAVYDALRA